MRVFPAFLQPPDHLAGDRSLLLQQLLPPFGEGPAKLLVRHERFGWFGLRRHGVIAMQLANCSSGDNQQVKEAVLRQGTCEGRPNVRQIRSG